MERFQNCFCAGLLTYFPLHRCDHQSWFKYLLKMEKMPLAIWIKKKKKNIYPPILWITLICLVDKIDVCVHECAGTRGGLQQNFSKVKWKNSRNSSNTFRLFQTIGARICSWKPWWFWPSWERFLQEEEDENKRSVRVRRRYWWLSSSPGLWTHPYFWPAAYHGQRVLLLHLVLRSETSQEKGYVGRKRGGLLHQ